MKKKKLKVLNQIIKYLAFFIMFYIMFKAKTITATGFYASAFYVALIAGGQNAIFLAPLFVLSAFLSGENLISVGLYAIVSLVYIVTFIVHKQIKRNYSKLTLNLILALSTVPFFIMDLTVFGALFNLLNLGLSILFLNVIFNFVVAALSRKIYLKLNTDEILSAMLFICIFASGLKNVVFFNFPAGSIIAYYLIAISGLALSSSSTLLISSSISFGYLLGGANAICFIPFTLLALISLVLKKSGKWLMAVGNIICFAASIYFFVDYKAIIFEGIAFLVATVLFLCSTKTFVRELGEFVNGRDAYAPSVLSYTKASLKRKIENTSAVIGLVSNVLKRNVKQQISIEDGKEILSEELINLVCKKCSNYGVCHTLHNDTKSAINNFFASGLVRGKITLLDVPPFLTNRCKNVPVLLNEVNNMCQKFLKFNVMQNGANEGTIIATKQLDSVNEQLNKLSVAVSDKTVFNTKLESEVEKLLIYKNLIPTKVFCVEENGRFVFTITFKESYVNVSDVISEVVSTVIKKPASVTVIDDRTFTAIDAPLCDVVFGVATECKLESSESGDSYNFFKMTDDNALFALCDGMGSGERAHEISDYALTLVEAFYKAEFDKEQIYSSINKLLVMQSKDEFCALDVCLIDLFKRSFSLFKLGAPESFVKRLNEVEILNSGALPIGIVDESEPKVETRLLELSDIVILVSDGVSDSFKNAIELKEFIERLDDTNPQTLADKILNECKIRNKNALKDDTTILAFRLFEKKK